MMRHITEQETFWAGEFGDAYTRRNSGEGWVASNTALFSRILRSAPGVESVLELGANKGLNLRALRRLLPDAHLAGVEINHAAAEELREWGGAKYMSNPSTISVQRGLTI